MWAEQSENDHKKTDMKNIMEKIGLDKFAHFFAGATIAYTVGNLMALQEGADGWGFAVLALAGLVCAAVAGLIKELLDGKPDWHDMLATVLGGLLPLLANTIGTLLCVLSGS